MNKYFFFILLLILGSCYNKAKAYGDKTFVKAEMVTSVGDTIIGYIEFENSYKGNITYTLEKDSKEKCKINCGRLLQLSTSRWTFKRMYYDRKYYLLRTLCEGRISLYYYPYTTPEKSIMTGNSMYSYGTVKHKKYYLRKNEKTTILKLKRAFKVIPEKMSDCEMISEELENLKKRKSCSEYGLIQIIDSYNGYFEK